MNKYCFVCLFRADSGASGLAFRMPILWNSLVECDEIVLVINKSLADKTLKENISRKNLYVIPEYLGFRASCLIAVPLILIYLLIKGFRAFHLSVGGAYFAGLMDRLRRVAGLKSLVLHTSIGSRSIKMASGGNEKYERLHDRLLAVVDKVDCLYDSSGFGPYQRKFVRSPGSFSWRYGNVSAGAGVCQEKFLKEKRIIYAGSLLDQKNYRMAIDGFSRYLRNNPGSGVEFHIFAPLVSSDVRNMINGINIEAKKEAIFVREDSELDEALKGAYIFLSLQSYDNYPSQSLIEAMQHGCTVIATDTGETRRLVKPEDGNYLVSLNVDDFLNALEVSLSLNPVENKKNIERINSEHSVEAYSKYFYVNFIKKSEDWISSK